MPELPEVETVCLALSKILNNSRVSDIEIFRKDLRWDVKENLEKDLKERIDFELDTIKNTGYPGYFLIVEDFIRKAREMNVSVGPGRGSGAGSPVYSCIHHHVVTIVDDMSLVMIDENDDDWIWYRSSSIHHIVK